jgi:hypothetical protein
MLASPRDNGANALELVFREGSPFEAERNANHAITEDPPCRTAGSRKQGISRIWLVT